MCTTKGSIDKNSLTRSHNQQLVIETSSKTILQANSKRSLLMIAGAAGKLK
jgi:hypothetical protein